MQIKNTIIWIYYALSLIGFYSSSISISSLTSTFSFISSWIILLSKEIGKTKISWLSYFFIRLLIAISFFSSLFVFKSHLISYKVSNEKEISLSSDILTSFFEGWTLTSMAAG